MQPKGTLWHGIRGSRASPLRMPCPAGSGVGAAQLRCAGCGCAPVPFGDQVIGTTVNGIPMAALGARSAKWSPYLCFPRSVDRAPASLGNRHGEGRRRESPKYTKGMLRAGRVLRDPWHALRFGSTLPTAFAGAGAWSPLAQHGMSSRHAGDYGCGRLDPNLQRCLRVFGEDAPPRTGQSASTRSWPALTPSARPAMAKSPRLRPEGPARRRV